MGTDSFLQLDDGASIAVVGGGPTGSFFSIFALKMAKMMGKDLNVTIFEPKDFTREGPAGCNHCGGVISEIMVQTLALEGIILPDSVVQKGINSFKLHTSYQSTHIETPSEERTIATVYRGGGPRGRIAEDKESFDRYLLNLAIKEGAVHEQKKIDSITYNNKKPVLFSKRWELCSPDLVVGAFGLNATSAKVFEKMGFGYRMPKVTTGAVAEFFFDPEIITEHFGSSIHSFLLPDKNIRMAAFIPKGTYVTVCILGKEINAKTVEQFLELPAVKKIMPHKQSYKPDCMCLPKINLDAPRTAFDDRVIVCGDAGSTRLYKDGLGAAYSMGKSAAKAAVFDGVGKKDFQGAFYQAYKNTNTDNLFGKYLFMVTDLYRKSRIMTQGMVNVIQQEQEKNDGKKLMSSIIWDMFTGNKKYKNVVLSAFNMRLHLDLWREFLKSIF